MEPEEIGLLLGRIEGKLDGVVDRLDKQNGRIDRAEDAIGGLKVRDAYTAGIAIGAAGLWDMVKNKLFG